MLESSYKRGQVALFVIVALVLVGAIIVYFVLGGRTQIEQIPSGLSPVYSYYEQCIAQATGSALETAGSQGGYVQVPVIVPGSEYAPLSSHLSFLGLNIPYWYYLSGNGIVKEQVPSQQSIENELALAIEEELRDCAFDAFEERGFLVSRNDAEVQVSLADAHVNVEVRSPLSVSFEGAQATKIVHKAEVSSKFGKFYRLAKEIYNKEKKESFLENYSVDVLRLYAPVDGVAIGCSPRVWKTREVVEQLRQGLSANLGALRFASKSAADVKQRYFALGENIDENVQFLYLSNWPSKIEIHGAENELMIAEPIGNQEGLGILGFCYAPYHFVYDLAFPVLIQLYDEQEIFQFPVSIIIDKNMPRVALAKEAEGDEGISEENVDFCEFPNKEIQVNVYNTELAKVEGRVYYTCFDQRCPLGDTRNGTLIGKAPTCLNGYLEVAADGYAHKKQLFSTNIESAADIIMDKEYDAKISVRVDGKKFEGTAFVSFIGTERTTSVALPDLPTAKLSEGLYNVTVYAYSNSSLVIPRSTKTQCAETAHSGLLGLFGGTKTECFDIVLPETRIDHALVGGGRGETYLFASDFVNGSLILDVGALPTPNTLEQLQQNYYAFDGLNVEVKTT